MALHSKRNTEDLIARLDKKNLELIEIVKGTERKPDSLSPPGTPIEIYVDDRNLRVVVGEFNVLLKEVLRLEKSS